MFTAANPRSTLFRGYGSARKVLGLFGVILLGPGLAADGAVLEGRVLDASGQPVAHATVVAKENLEAVSTDDQGRYRLEVPDAGPVTLSVVDATGKTWEKTVPDPKAGKFDLLGGGSRGDTTLAMEPVTVMAGDFSAGKMPGAVLTALEVVSTPGAAADINRALQTLPGIQLVDEGNALYVRGGDYWETGTFINNGYYPSAFRLEAPTGTFEGTVNPFLTESIHFISGGFGARYGNLLSGVVALETQDRPVIPGATFNAGIGAISFGGDLPIGSKVGIRATATKLDLAPMFKLNGAPRTFAPAPRGDDLSGSAIWDYSAQGQLKLFAIQQENRFGVWVNEPGYTSVYAHSVRNRFAVMEWKHSVGEWSPSASFSAGSVRRSETVGSLAITTDSPQARLSGQAGYAWTDQSILTFGGEFERVANRTTGQKPGTLVGYSPTLLDVASEISGDRVGGFVEADVELSPRWRMIAGLRLDDSTLSKQVSVDPRWSASYRLARGISLTGAVGRYHQVADAVMYNDVLQGERLPTMSATHEIVGIKVGEGAQQLRIEAYRKDYQDLAQFDRNLLVSRGGLGRSQGIDFFEKAPLPWGLRQRVTLSLLQAQRTDPNTGVLAAAPFGIRSSLTAIVERDFTNGYQAGLSFRSASGRPYTEVVGGFYDPGRGTYAPEYGGPFAARLPEYQRLDLSLHKLTFLRKGLLAVWYCSVSNVLGRKNATDVTYSSDYAKKQEISGLFSRSIYLGITFVYL